MEWLSTASDIVGVWGALFALLAWIQARRTQRELAQERARANERVEIELVLTQERRTRRLPIALRRADVSRAELLGRLGMVPMRESGRRFALTYLADPTFLAQVARVQAGEGNVITIPCTAAEFEQFA
jgi:hypothetical protein